MKDYPVVTLQDQSEFKEEQTRQIKELLMMMAALLVLSIVIAVLAS